MAVIGYNAPLGPYKNHPLSNADVEADTIACVHLDSVWNNVIYDLQPNGSIVFSVPPEPSDFIGIHIYIQSCSQHTRSLFKRIFEKY